MALIGIDSYTPSPGATGTSVNASTAPASAQVNATATSTTNSGGTTAPQTGPQPLNATGTRGTAVNLVT
jgi:hypothetical protein